MIYIRLWRPRWNVVFEKLIFLGHFLRDRCVSCKTYLTKISNLPDHIMWVYIVMIIMCALLLIIYSSIINVPLQFQPRRVFTVTWFQKTGSHHPPHLPQYDPRSRCLNSRMYFSTLTEIHVIPPPHYHILSEIDTRMKSKEKKQNVRHWWRIFGRKLQKFQAKFVASWAKKSGIM